jgi:hypothetical protein
MSSSFEQWLHVLRQPRFCYRDEQQAAAYAGLGTAETYHSESARWTGISWLAVSLEER